MIDIKNSGSRRALSFALCLIFLFALAPDSQSFAADKWVGPGGKDIWSGNSKSRRWRTLNHAMRNLQPGDTLTLTNGRYDIRDGSGHANGVIPIRKPGSGRLDGSPSRVTVIRAENKGRAFIKGNLTIAGSYIRVENLKLFGDENNEEPGIKIADSHHIDLYNNEIGWCGGGGINADHSDTLRVIGNEIYNCGLRNFDQHSGISIFQPIPFPDPENRYWRIEIRRNKSSRNINYNPGRYGITDGNGIIVDDYYYDQTQFLNRFHRQVIGNNDQYPHRTLIEGNICNDNGGTGILCYLTSGIFIKNNTLVGNNTYLFDTNWHFRNRGQIRIMYSDSAYIVNNVFQSKPVPFAHGYGGAPYAASEMRGSSNFWDNNLFHTTVSGSLLLDGRNVGTNGYFFNPKLTDDLRSSNSWGLGITWDNHTYEDFYGRKVRGGQRTDLGAIQN